MKGMQARENCCAVVIRCRVLHNLLPPGRPRRWMRCDGGVRVRLAAARGGGARGDLNLCSRAGLSKGCSSCSRCCHTAPADSQNCTHTHTHTHTHTRRPPRSQHRRDHGWHHRWRHPCKRLRAEQCREKQCARGVC
eukprot:1514791-Rhodomonas_salina.1